MAGQINISRFIIVPMINNVEGIVFNLEKSVILTIFHIITEPKMRHSLKQFKKKTFKEEIVDIFLIFIRQSF